MDDAIKAEDWYIAAVKAAEAKHPGLKIEDNFWGEDPPASSSSSDDDEGDGKDDDGERNSEDEEEDDRQDGVATT